MSRPDKGGPEPLAGGWSTEGVVRIGGTVRRPMSTRAPFVHELLLRLERSGFRACPRYRGVDPEGREVLTYLEGEVHHGEQGRWTDRQLRQAAVLLRDFHAATAGTGLAGSEEVVCHNDYAPWNVVFTDGVPTAIIDFDDARPGPRVRDVSYAIWCWLGLGGVADVGVAEQGRRMGVLCEAYGLADTDDLLDEISHRQREVLRQYLERGRPERARRVAAETEWLRLNRAGLQNGLSSRQQRHEPADRAREDHGLGSRSGE